MVQVVDDQKPYGLAGTAIRARDVQRCSSQTLAQIDLSRRRTSPSPRQGEGWGEGPISR